MSRQTIWRSSFGGQDRQAAADRFSDRYDLWLGPAQDLPIFRKEFHYDWHWNFNTGSADGQLGVHVLDDARNNVFLDKVTLPDGSWVAVDVWFGMTIRDAQRPLRLFRYRRSTNDHRFVELA